METSRPPAHAPRSGQTDQTTISESPVVESKNHRRITGVLRLVIDGLALVVVTFLFVDVIEPLLSPSTVQFLDDSTHQLLHAVKAISIAEVRLWPKAWSDVWSLSGGSLLGIMTLPGNIYLLIVQTILIPASQGPIGVAISIITVIVALIVSVSGLVNGGSGQGSILAAGCAAVLTILFCSVLLVAIAFVLWGRPRL